MRRVTFILLVGIVSALLGLGLLLWSHDLATRWEQLGPQAWGGETDPGLQRTYLGVGFSFLIFGLVLAGWAAFQWLQAETRYTTGARSPF